MKIIYRFIFLIFLSLKPSIGILQNDYRTAISIELEKQEEPEFYLRSGLKESSDDLERAVFHNFLGVQFQRKFLLDSALVHHERAFNLLKNKFAEHHEMAITLNKMGIVYLYQDNIELAADFFQLSSEKFKDKSEKANALNNLGLSKKYLGLVDEAIESYDLSFQMFLESENFEKALDVKLNAAALHNGIGNDSIATNYLNEILDISIEHGLNEQQYRAKSELAVLAREEGSYEKSLDLHQQCELFFNEEGLINYQVVNLNNMAILYGEQEQYEKEIEIYHQLLKLCQEHHLYSYELAVKTNLGSTQILMGNFSEAEKNLISAEGTALEMGNLTYLISIYESLTSLYKEKNDSEKALFYSEKKDSYRDSLNESERIKSIIHSEQAQKNKELRDSLKRVYGELSQSEIEIEQQETKNNIWITLAISFLILAIFFGLARRIWKKRSLSLNEKVIESEQSKKKLQADLKKQKEELTFLSQNKKKPYPAELEPLTDREKQVLFYLAEGKTDKQISEAIFLSPSTVRTHLRKAYVKIGVTNRAQATQFVNAHQL